jgi:dipeptidyl aminopeptidase/acylaminoacyl peptidase
MARCVCRWMIAVLLLGSLAAGQKRPFTFEDMMALKRVGEPVPSPDGHWVLFTAVDVSLQENTRKPHIWIVPLSGGESRQITKDPAGEDRPRWSPDGKRFLFTSSREGGSQVWIADFDSQAGAISGEPHKLTTISTEASGALWSPDGKNVVFTSDVWPDCKGKPNEDACNKAKDDEQAKSKVKAKVFTRLLYRHWNAYASGKRSHLFAQPVNADGTSAGAAHDLTPGDYAVPPFSLGGQDDYAISPDGQEVCYTSNHDEVEAISTNNDLFIVPIAGGPSKKITTNPASDSSPLYSPDGKYIAYRAQVRAGYESDRFRLMLYERAGGKITNLTERFDQWVGTYVWTPNSAGLYFTAEDTGESPIYNINIEREVIGGEPGDDVIIHNTKINIETTIRGHDDDLAITRDGKTLLFSRMAVTSPNDIFIADRSTITTCNSQLSKPTASAASGPTSPTSDCDRFQSHQLTHLNDAVLSQVSMQPLEPFWFTGSERAKVEGFIMKPPGFDANKKYPVKFLIHGGPQGAWGDSWSFRWNPELFAANGYVVVMINPRGSTGYGQKFIDDINGDWGGRAYQDLMLGLDYAERTYPFIDKQRECALGASYGGYMIDWIAGRTTRFKCLVSHDGMFNSTSAYGSTEELWFNEWEFKGTPWTNPEMYRKWSPNLAAPNFHTPTLIIHSQLDYRLDVSEGLQFFTYLQRLKVPSKMLYFPDEGHWVLKPQNSQLWYKTVNDWVDQWVGK